MKLPKLNNTTVYAISVFLFTIMFYYFYFFSKVEDYHRYTESLNHNYIYVDLGKEGFVIDDETIQKKIEKSMYYHYEHYDNHKNLIYSYIQKKNIGLQNGIMIKPGKKCDTMLDLLTDSYEIKNGDIPELIKIVFEDMQECIPLLEIENEETQKEIQKEIQKYKK